MRIRFTYKLLINGVEYSANPALNDATLSYSKDGARRGFRREMSGSVVFYNDVSKGISDYNIIMVMASMTDVVRLKIYRDGIFYWEGAFNRYDCKVDQDKNTIEVTPRVYDEYYSFISKVDIERNILTGIMDNNPMAIQPNTITLEYKNIYPTEDEVLYDTVSLPPNTGAQIPNNIKEYVKTGEANKDRFFLAQIDYTKDSSGVWDVIMYYKREYVIDASGLVSPGAGFSLATDQSNAPIGSYKWVRPYQNLYSTYANYTKVNGIDHYIFSVPQLNYTPPAWVNQRARKLNDVLTAFAVSFGLTFKSDILTKYNNYAHDVSINNIQENPLRNIMMIQKSDVRKTSNAAWKGMVSFSGLMQILNDMLNLWWYVEGGVLHIEHESWFVNQPGIDLTSQEYEIFIRGSNAYEYKGELPRYEVWQFMEAKDADFVGVPIEYTFIEGIEESTKDRVISDVTTDIEYVIKTPDEISNDGWVFVVCDANNYILQEPGILTGIMKHNAHLSSSNIQHHYFRHGRPFASGKMNRKNTTFLSTEKKKVQKNISFAPSLGFDPQKTIKTYLGWGEVESAEENIKTETITVTLKYD